MAAMGERKRQNPCGNSPKKVVGSIFPGEIRPL